MKKIYIIEDESDISNLYTMLFDREGIEVEGVVSSGKTAIEKIEQFKEKIHDIVFIIDIRIPEKSGIEVVRKLLEIAPDIKNQIIIATADDRITKKEITDLGIPYFLRKPFSLDELLQTIEEIQNR